MPVVTGIFHATVENGTPMCRDDHFVDVRRDTRISHLVECHAVQQGDDSW